MSLEECFQEAWCVNVEKHFEIYLVMISNYCLFLAYVIDDLG